MDVLERGQRSVADQVTAILADSARQPGIGDMLSLMRISAESFQMQQLENEMVLPVVVTQTTGLTSGIGG